MSQHGPPEVPPDFWCTEAMAAALASGDLGRVVRTYRSHPFHGEQLTQSLVADWLHISQSTLSRIELGKRRLTVDEIVGFARALGLPLSLRWMAHNEEARQEVDISRRSLLGVGVGAAIGFGATTPAAAREVDPELVSHWMALLDVLDRHDAMFGARPVLGTVTHELELIAQHRRMARGELRTQLLRVEARWAEFASWLSHDMADARMRDSWAMRASRLSEAADDNDMAACVLLRRSQWAIGSSDPAQAVACALAARSRASSVHLRALGALKEAQGHALDVAQTSCRQSLDDARGLVAQADRGDAESSVWDLATHETTPPYVQAAEARCWLWLDPRSAVDSYDAALREWSADRPRSRGINTARLALACAAAGEADRAAAEGMKALEITRGTGSRVATAELRRLDRRLGSTAGADDFREAFASLN